MRKTLWITIAATALIAGAGLATAQQIEREPGRAPKAVQSPYLGQPGAGALDYPLERQPGAPAAMEKAPSQEQSAVEEKKNSRSGPPGAMQREGQGQAGSDMGKPMEHRSVTTLSLEQRTKLHQAITMGNFQRADQVKFSLAVGTRLPASVRVYDVPESIVEIVPEYRGFKYIVVQGELIIVDPGTLEIVAVLPA